MQERDVMLVTGAGQISMAIARRLGYGKKIVMGDKNLGNAKAIAEIMNNAGYDVEPVMSERGAFITGSTILMDGGATASYYYGPLQP